MFVPVVEMHQENAVRMVSLFFLHLSDVIFFFHAIFDLQPLDLGLSSVTKSI
jgi:hypothetical protein